MVALDEDKKPVLDPRKWNQKPQMGEDKLEHFGAAAVMTAGLYYLGLPVWVALMITVGFFYGKEVWDSLGNGYPDIWDLIASVLGALLIASVIAIYKYKNGSKSS